MSKTFSIACINCRESLWIGQKSYSPNSVGYIYTGKENLEYLRKFLFDHIEHNLIFKDNESLCVDDYKQLYEEE